MLRKALAHWLKRPWTFMFMIVGYVISILIISMSIGDIDNPIIEEKTSMLGEIGERSVIELYSYAGTSFKYALEETIEYLGSFGEVDVLNMGNIDVVHGGYKSRAEIVPAYYEKTPNWQPPLYKGAYITPEQCKSGSNTILIGAEVAKELNVKVNDTASISGKDYVVKGIMGQPYDFDKFNSIVYVPMKALPEEIFKSMNDKWLNNESHMLKADILYRVKNNQISEINKKINEKFYKNKLVLDVGKIYESSVSYKRNLIITLETKTPLIIAAIVNISTMAVFWVISRKKELTIKKILGAKDKYIKNSIRTDMFVVIVISAILAILVQTILYMCFEVNANKCGYTFKLNLANASISIIIAFFIGFISSEFPARKTLEITPVEGIKVE